MVFFVLVLFCLKQFLCDYVFQNQYMMGKTKKIDWKLPLSAHSLVHGFGTFLIISLVTTVSLGLVFFLVDTFLHFMIDRAKVVLSEEADSSTKKYWVYFGLDQFSHSICHYGYILILTLL